MSSSAILSQAVLRHALFHCRYVDICCVANLIKTTGCNMDLSLPGRYDSKPGRLR